MQALAQFSFNKSVLYSDTAKTNKKIHFCRESRIQMHL